MNILLVEDDPDIAANLGLFFEQKGYRMDFAYNGAHGLELGLSGRFDLIILDLMLPGMDGIKVCQKLRASAAITTPVLMLTARDTLDDKEEGFNAGADDYLVKPFSLRELDLRVTALTRRNRAGLADHLSLADLTLNSKTREVHRAGRPIKLKPKAFKILEYLMRYPNEVISRERLTEAIWTDDPPDGDPLRVHVHHLRQQVDQPFDKSLIHTVHGVGYRISEAPST